MNAELQAQPPGDFRLLIDGELVPGSQHFDVVNPATEQVLAPCPRADRTQLDRAVASAKAAFPAWSRRSISERRQLLMRLAAALSTHSSQLARLLTQEQGKPLPLAAAEIGGASALIRALAAMDLPTKILKDTDTLRVVQQHTPLGVVATITPWNFPVLLLMIKITPALLAGNTVVVKPAPTTPLTTLRFGELCAQIFPAGVINVIVDLNDLGDALTSHPDIAKIAFTGSTATGRKVMASAANTVKRLTLELGGNDAGIVLDDVNPEEVAPKIFNAAMLNSGQVCFAIKRLYVPDSIYDILCSELARLADAAVVGDGLEEGTQFGPVQNKAQFEKVKEFLAEAQIRGKIIAGGKLPKRAGYFISPTIVRDIPDDARLVQEEQFGPILPVLRYSDVNDAIARANDSSYGLGATVWSANPTRAYEVAQRIEAGIVWINKHLDMLPDIAFGGAKQSGFGAEMGQEGLEEFTQAKIINMVK
jgi:acyl-CoA reductase-like NAD-dependent aldehyde dehydrogenase